MGAPDYKTPGTKAFKKMSFLKEKMTEEDYYVRQKALAIYNEVMKTEYDPLIQELEKELEAKEKIIKPSRKNLLLGRNEPEKPGDKLVINEIKGLKFKLRYYNGLKDSEIDSRLRKKRIKI